jgi:hypothetical protein
VEGCRVRPTVLQIQHVWFADIYCDLAWIAERGGVLGPSRFTITGPRSLSLGVAIDYRLYGDEHTLRHVRVLMHTDDHKVADKCVDLNIQTWVTSIEVPVMMETRRPFHVPSFPGPQKFGIVLGQGDDNSVAAVIHELNTPPAPIDYQRLAVSVGAWGTATSNYLFYFRRFVDNSLPLDVRWLNGYRLLEWHFVGDKANLQKAPAWRKFLTRFEDDLKAKVTVKNRLCAGI